MKEWDSDGLIILPQNKLKNKNFLTELFKLKVLS